MSGSFPQDPVTRRAGSGPSARETDSSAQTAVPGASNDESGRAAGSSDTARGGPEILVRDPLEDLNDETAPGNRVRAVLRAYADETQPGAVSSPRRLVLEDEADDEEPVRVDVERFGRNTDISQIREALFAQSGPRNTGPGLAVAGDDPGFEPDPTDDIAEETLPDALRDLLDSYVSTEAAPAAGVMKPPTRRDEPVAAGRNTPSPPEPHLARGAGSGLKSMAVSGRDAEEAARRLKQEAWKRRARRLAGEG